MTIDRATRPLPGCPARAGHGTDIRAASFTFVVEDHPAGGHPAITEIFGFYQIPGQDPDDLVQAAGFEVPARSPIARLARQVAASPTRTRTLGAILRGNVLSCPCAPAGECPALDEVRLLRAIEHAARATRRRDPGPRAADARVAHRASRRPAVTGCPAVRVAVCYDGCWYQHAARFFARARGAEISVAGLHDVIRWHAAVLFGCSVQRVAVTQAHYIADTRRGAHRYARSWMRNVHG